MARHWEQSEWPSLVTRPVWRPPTLNREVLPAPEEWMERGACVGRWPEWDLAVEGESHVERTARHRRVARVCRSACPVLEQCRAWGDHARAVGEFGVVAGRVPKKTDGQGNRKHWVEVREEVA